MNEHRQRCLAAQYNLERCKEYFYNVKKRILCTELVYMKRVSSNGSETLMEVRPAKVKGEPVKKSTLDGNVMTMDCMPDYYCYMSRIKEHEDAVRRIMQEAKSCYFAHFEEMKEHYLGACYAERRAAYDDYLSSNAWQKKRMECLSYYGHKCGDCGMHDSALQCHHLHYETLGDEDPKTDLIPLCKQCHQARHT